MATNSPQTPSRVPSDAHGIHRGHGVRNAFVLSRRTGRIAFAKQTQHLSLYILKQPVFDAHRADLAGLSLGKGCIRYRQPDQINWRVVESLLADTRDTTGDIC